jgi:hypothetical protein
MRVPLRRLMFAGVGLTIALGAAAGATSAKAYGTEHLYQVTLSENCMNKALCVAGPQNPFGIGGIWGWIEPDQGGTADTAVVAQGHSNADPSLNGTVHFPSSWDWTVIHLTTAPPPIVSPPDPNGNYFLFTIPGIPFFQFLTPATPGHYSATLGPGVSAQVTVVQMH